MPQGLLQQFGAQIKQTLMVDLLRPQRRDLVGRIVLPAGWRGIQGPHNIAREGGDVVIGMLFLRRHHAHESLAAGDEFAGKTVEDDKWQVAARIRFVMRGPLGLRQRRRQPGNASTIFTVAGGAGGFVKRFAVGGG